MIFFSWLKTPSFGSKKWLILHTVNRDLDSPFWNRLHLNPNSGRKIQRNGLKKRHIKCLDPYLSISSSNWIPKLVNAEKTHKEILFIPRATISSKSTCKKIHAPDWSIASTIMQFGACLTSSALRESEGEHAKAKFRRNLNSDSLLTFLLSYSLENLGKSLIYYVRNFHSLGYTH